MPTGRSTHELVGASPFPRHWIYDDAGAPVEKSGIIDFDTWFNDSFGDRTPWGDTTRRRSSRPSSRRSSGGCRRDHARRRQAEDPDLGEGRDAGRPARRSSNVYLILDGVFVVEVDRKEVAEIGPGAVVGERAALEGGARTATLRATTKARVAEVKPDQLDRAELDALATAHHREEK